MENRNRLISHLAFPIDFSIISINRPTTSYNHILLQALVYFITAATVAQIPKSL